MSDGQILFATVAALYLIECVHWCPPDCWVIRRAPGRPGRRLDTANAPETVAGTPCFVSLLPWATLHVLPVWPCAPAADGISLGPALTLPGAKRQRAARRRMAYEDLAGVEADGSRIEVRERKLRIRAGSARLATVLAQLLEALRTSAPAERAALADAARRAGTGATAFEERLALFDRHARRVQAAAALQFGTLFFLAPLLVGRLGFAATWMVVLAAVVLLDLVIAVLFFAAHRALRPSDRGGRWMQAATIALCPTVAIRAVDRLGADLLGDAHVARGAALLLERSDAVAALAALARELEHPAALPVAGDEAFHQAALHDARASELRCVETVAGTLGSDPAALRRIDPAAWPAEARSYCPRCLEALLVSGASCPSCGIATVALESRSGDPAPAPS